MANDVEQKDIMDTPICTCACFFRFCMLSLGFSQILVGSLCLTACPLQRFIPIYLVVNGVLLIVMLIASFAFAVKCNIIYRYAFWLMSIFWFAWLVTGSVWTFPLYNNFEGCSRELYLFMFSNLIIQWILLVFTPRAVM